MKQEKIFFISGIICLISALFVITILPWAFEKQSLFYPDYYYTWLEFVLLFLASIFYHFAPKYYYLEMFSVVVGILYYLFFTKIPI